MSKEKKGSGKSLSEFASMYDKDTIVPKKIREAIDALGPDCWEYEQEFIKRAGISTYDMSTYREQFSDEYVLSVGKHSKRVWAGSPEMKAKMEEMV